MRQPPVLHVALHELAARGAQQVSARLFGPREGQRHTVLELIAKAVGAAGLVEGRAGPDAADQCLVEQPAIEQDVHRAVGRAHLHGAQQGIPMVSHPPQFGVQVGLSPARRQRHALLRVAALPEQGDHVH